MRVINPEGTGIPVSMTVELRYTLENEGEYTKIQERAVEFVKQRLLDNSEVKVLVELDDVTLDHLGLEEVTTTYELQVYETQEDYKHRRRGFVASKGHRSKSDAVRMAAEFVDEYEVIEIQSDDQKESLRIQ